jgi:hypothetical protein
LQELDDKLFDLNAEHVTQPEDFCTTLSDATEAARDEHYADLDASHMLRSSSSGSGDPKEQIEGTGSHHNAPAT